MVQLRTIWLIMACWVFSSTASAQGGNSAPIKQALLAACDGPDHARTLNQSAPMEPLEARVVWLNGYTLQWPGIAKGGRFRLYYSAHGQIRAIPGSRVRGHSESVELEPFRGQLGQQWQSRFAYLADGIRLNIPGARHQQVSTWLRGQVLITHEDEQGIVLEAAATQAAGALDDEYATAGKVPDLGVSIIDDETRFKLWAPTAQAVWLCLYDGADRPASFVRPLTRDEATGVWRIELDKDLSGAYYTYLVDVFVAASGVVRNRVTDPYALSLSADSQRVYIANLDDPSLKPEGWDGQSRLSSLPATDRVIYELHVRDFSINDPSVRPEYRGKYQAFTEQASHGMDHLRALAEAGLSDLHLLPVFDMASVPERDCLTPEGLQTGHQKYGPASDIPQALVTANKERDCFNWGYDPYHYSAPEGSYSSDANDGATRIREFREMVLALNRAGLRVGMDVVYNHTHAAGQDKQSVLDRIVPGYYQRLDERGQVHTSTCCANTATENLMMAKLMIDSAVMWARDYRIGSFRFDLMGHQPRAAMERLQVAVNEAVGQHVLLIGEGWNFAEVADGARFVQASQMSLSGSGIATFSDRARDAVRGGGCCESGAALVREQGYINGLHYAPNDMTKGRHSRTDLLRKADWVRVGLAGTLSDFKLQNWRGDRVRLAEIDYAGQAAGYAGQPGEVVNYVSNHDNQTLFDINALRLPRSTPANERARVQLLGLAVVAFSQGIAYYHAGADMLRSKSLDHNSFNSGDWFNRINWSPGQQQPSNYFGVGLPLAEDNEADWPYMQPLLAAKNVAPSAGEMLWTRDAFRDLLRIRMSSSLFRLQTAGEVINRLHILNTGPRQIATVLAGHLDGEDYPGAAFREIMYLINVDTQSQELDLPTEVGKPYVLHPLHRSAEAADRRAAESARFEASRGRFTLPPRTAVVFVVE